MKKILMFVMMMGVLFSTAFGMRVNAAEETIALCTQMGMGHDPNVDIVSLMSADATAAQKFTVSVPFNEIRINGCTCGNASGSTYSFKLYVWNTDYATTVADSPLVEQHGCVVTDNEQTSITFDTQESGTYLWVMGNPSVDDGSVGLWKFAAGGSTNSESYVDGKVIEGDMEACVVIAEMPVVEEPAQDEPTDSVGETDKDVSSDVTDSEGESEALNATDSSENLSESNKDAPSPMYIALPIVVVVLSVLMVILVIIKTKKKN